MRGARIAAPRTAYSRHDPGALSALDAAFLAIESDDAPMHVAGPRCSLRRSTYISTAYVAGTHRGLSCEDDLELGQGFRNAYEQSKHEAGLLVHDHARRLPITVVRPSIVVGDRRGGWTASFNVLYWPLRALAHGAYPVLPAPAARPSTSCRSTTPPTRSSPWPARPRPSAGPTT